MKYMLIQWIEDPPSWDVLPVQKIVNGHCTIGSICDVEYQQESSPAKILSIGSRSAMMAKLEILERSTTTTRKDEDEPDSEIELGRGKREKYHKVLTDSDEDYEGSSTLHVRKKARTSTGRAKSFLEQYREERLNHMCDTPKTAEKQGECSDPAIRDEIKELKTLILGLQAQVACLQKMIENKAIPTVAVPPEPCLDVVRLQDNTPVQPTKETPKTDNPKVKIGANTHISPGQYALIKWGDSKKATKDLCVAVFGRQMLATHSVTGQNSNAFRERAPKPQLDLGKIADILEFISAKCGVPKVQIKKSIAQKCSDEEKLAKRRQALENM